MNKNNRLKLIQWNIRSIKSNRDNLITLTRNENPDIVCLNETWLKSNENFNLNAYNIVRQDREDGYGGVATCIRKNILFSKVNSSSSENVQSVTVKIGETYIINIYSNDNSYVSNSLLGSLTANIPKNKIIVTGDLNSHHPIWDEAPINKGGKAVCDFVIDNDLVIMNDGSATLLQNPICKVSAVDLTITSSQLASNSSWGVIQDSGNSNHFPTYMEYNFKNSDTNKIYINSYKIRNFNKADWQAFNDKIIIQLSNKNLNISYKELVQIINSAADESIPLKTCGMVGKIGSPWWDKECDSWLKERKNGINNFNAYPTLDNFIQTKKIIAFTKKKVPGKKRGKFKVFCESLNR